jgi:trans-aconitate methyltransferase
MMGFCVSEEILAMFERRRGQSPNCQLFQEDLAKASASANTLHHSLQAVLAALQTQNKLLAGVIFALASETAIAVTPLLVQATPLQPLYGLVTTLEGALQYQVFSGAGATSRPSGSPLP